MKTGFVGSILLLSLCVSVAHGAQKTKKKVETAPKAAVEAPSAAPKKKLSKDISFSGSQVDGKYLSAGESIAEVEGDKEMSGLIGIRKNFRDRLSIETARLQAQTSQAASSGKGQ